MKFERIYLRVTTRRAEGGVGWGKGGKKLQITPIKGRLMHIFSTIFCAFLLRIS